MVQTEKDHYDICEMMYNETRPLIKIAIEFSKKVAILYFVIMADYILLASLTRYTL